MAASHHLELQRGNAGPLTNSIW